jgi:hypothetical protein
MIGNVINSDNRKFSLYVTIKCKGERKFRVAISDYAKANSKYGDREIVVKEKRCIYFNFPVSPKKLALLVADMSDGTTKDFEVTTMEAPLRTYDIWLDSETKDFLQLATHFSQVCGFEQASQTGRIFTTEDKKFTIKYFDVIREQLSGKNLNTPARIGHRTGIIETAKIKFDCYTIPMRMIILLHEFSHKYKNPKIGLEISNEVGADINALYIYLGLGYSKIDAICVFANVFLKAQTQVNIERMRKIMDYIQKFENQEFAKVN